MCSTCASGMSASRDTTCKLNSEFCTSQLLYTILSSVLIQAIYMKHHFLFQGIHRQHLHLYIGLHTWCKNIHVSHGRNVNTGQDTQIMIVQVHVCIKPHLFIGETAFSNLFMAGLDEDGRDLMIASALSNNKRAEYDLEKDKIVWKRTSNSLFVAIYWPNTRHCWRSLYFLCYTHACQMKVIQNQRATGNIRDIPD